MKLMHTKLPEFIRKMKAAAATTGNGFKDCEIVGLENLKSAKMQSLRTGRIEHAVEELAQDDETYKIEVAVMPRVPETMHSAVVRAWDKDGKPVKAILETINIIHPTEDVLLFDFDEISDRRPQIGKH